MPHSFRQTQLQRSLINIRPRRAHSQLKRPVQYRSLATTTCSSHNMAHRSLITLAICLTQSLASPVRRTAALNAPAVALPTPAATQPPRLGRRQDDGAYSYPAEGCYLTTFSEQTLTMTEFSTLDDGSLASGTSEDVVSGGPGCLCAGGTIAGLYTDTNTGGGTQNVYCATGLGEASTPTGEPVTQVTVCVFPITCTSREQ